MVVPVLCAGLPGLSGAPTDLEESRMAEVLVARESVGGGSESMGTVSYEGELTPCLNLERSA
jgi:hypothetical protein